MGHMEFVPTWTCDRAGRIKENLPKNSPILVSTGGGTTISNSLDDWAYSCDAFDIISVHDYGTTVSSTVPQLSSGMEKAKEYGKTIMFGEWGASGVSKAAIISDFVSALADAKIPHMIWQLVKPGAGSEDFELWTDEDAWQPFLDNSSYSKRMVKRTLPAMRKASYSPRAHAAPLHQQWTAKRQAASAIRAESLASRPHGLH